MHCKLHGWVMPRKSKTYRLDERVTGGLNDLARKYGSSANRWLENHLFALLKDEGMIDADALPLGETRGGDRRSQQPEDDCHAD